MSRRAITPPIKKNELGGIPQWIAIGVLLLCIAMTGSKYSETFATFFQQDSGKNDKYDQLQRKIINLEKRLN